MYTLAQTCVETQVDSMYSAGTHDGFVCAALEPYSGSWQNPGDCAFALLMSCH